ncbi:MAG: hypothetical protein WBX11_06500 [Thiobacillaceae bacterium]|jgi:hypothetical protein
MSKLSRLLILIGFLAASSVAGFFILNSTMAAPAFAQSSPPPCICSSLEKLEYRPVSPAEPMARIYVGQCQCGAMSCVVTTGALQCVK